MIKLYFISLIIVVSAITSCSYELEDVEPPNDLIPKDSFTDILKDMMILEAYVKTQRNNVHDFYRSMPASADSIFQNYNIDSSRYISSMDYYSNKQDILLEMYNEIQNEVTLESSDLQDKPESE